MPVARTRLAAGVLAAILVLLAVAAFRLLPATLSTGDRAFLELYALHATDTNLTVGPYSRFGWNHPGPTYFYLLAPLYALSGYHEYSLGLTALLVNVATIAALLLVISRLGDRHLGWSLVGALTIFLFRPGSERNVGELLTSPWNPHIVILPLSLLIILSAAFAVGRTSVLPAIALVATFVIQTHIGVAPCVLALVVAATAMWMRVRSASAARVVRPAMLWSVAVLTSLWMLPGWDQIAGTHNVSEIVRSLISGERPRPALSSTLAGFVYGLSSAVRPTQNLAVGNEIVSATSLHPLPVIWVWLQVAGLVVVWRQATRHHSPFHAALCVLCLLTAAAAGVSVLGIRGMVRDYLVFWMSAIGIAHLTVLGGAGLSWVARALGPRGFSLPPLGLPVATAFLGLVFLFGTVGLTQDYRRTLAGEGRFPARREAVQQLSRDVATRMREQDFGTARIRIAPPARAVAAGVVLQLLKTGTRVSVADPLVPMFTEALRSTGRADVTFRFVGSTLDAQLREQPDYLLVARYQQVAVYEQLR